MLLDCGSAFYTRSSKRILGRVRQALGLVVSDVLNAQELEDLKQDLAVMTECNGAVVRVTLLDQNMACLLYTSSASPVADHGAGC